MAAAHPGFVVVGAIVLNLQPHQPVAIPDPVNHPLEADVGGEMVDLQLLAGGPLVPQVINLLGNADVVPHINPVAPIAAVGPDDGLDEGDDEGPDPGLIHGGAPIAAVGPDDGLDEGDHEGPDLNLIHGGAAGPDLVEELPEIKEDEDNVLPNCDWKALGFVRCLLCFGKRGGDKEYTRKSKMVRHYHWRHKGASTHKTFLCTKCGQTVKKGHKCTVPRGYMSG